MLRTSRTSAKPLMRTSCDVAGTAWPSGPRRCHTRQSAMAWSGPLRHDNQVAAARRMTTRRLGLRYVAKEVYRRIPRGRLGCQSPTTRAARPPQPLPMLSLNTACNIVGYDAARCCQDSVVETPILKRVGWCRRSTVFRWRTALARDPNSRTYRSFFASTRHRAQTR